MDSQRRGREGKRKRAEGRRELGNDPLKNREEEKGSLNLIGEFVVLLHCRWREEEVLDSLKLTWYKIWGKKYTQSIKKLNF